MPDSLLYLIGLILITILLVVRFSTPLKGFIPNSRIGRKKLKIISLGSLALIAVITLSLLAPSILGSMFSTKHYYDNPDYWQEGLFFRGDQVVKIIGAHDPEAIYGYWEEIRRVEYKIEETSTGLIAKEIIYEYLYKNDQTVSIRRLKGGTLEARYHFNLDNRLSKAEINSRSGLTLLKNEYDDLGRLIMFSEFRDEKLNKRRTFEYLNEFDLKVLEYDSNGKIIVQKNIKYNKRGFPGHLSKEQEYRSFSVAELLSEDPSSMKGTKVFGIVEESEISYDGALSHTLINYSGNNKSESKEVVTGLGLEFISTKEGLEVYNNEFVYDSHDNWIACIRFKNSIAYQVDLRQITYKGGKIEGSINPDTIQLLR